MKQRGGKNTRRGEKYKRRIQETGGKEGRAEISYCSFLSLSLPSRLRGLLLGASWRAAREERGGGWTERKRAECPFTSVASD